MKAFKILGLLVGWAAAGVIAVSGAQAAENLSVVVHFGKGKSFLSTEDKGEIRALFSKFIIDAQTRVFVVGYTDSSGDQKKNDLLSRKRAHAVRREIVSAFGVDAAIVMAVGKGEANPVADNRHADGRALNRRAEIYMANARERHPKRLYGAEDPYLPDIQSLVQGADALIRSGQLDQAFGKLKQARVLGGDHYSDWHTAYGIAGYYAHAPMEQTRAHLDKALRLDPHNFHAREFLGRVDAGRKFARGEVTGEMGQGTETAIVVTAIAQEHEYLRLFGVEPLVHKTLDSRSLDIWECRDSSGGLRVYYFDYSGIYSWAFDQRGIPAAVRSDGTAKKDEISTAPASSAPQPVSYSVLDAADRSETIWGSTAFK